VLVGVATAVSDHGDPEDTELLALDAATGRERWRVAPGVLPRAVAVAGDRVYTDGRDGRVAALDFQ
jgi:outer membrane protein assembly factor BamB